MVNCAITAGYHVQVVIGSFMGKYSPEEMVGTIQLWIALHWIRVALALASFVLALLAVVRTAQQSQPGIARTAFRPSRLNRTRKERPMNETSYPAGGTALLFIDPYNDFLAEDGKMWPALREVTTSVDLHANLARVRAAVLDAGMPIFILPHHRHEPTDFEGWSHLTPSQRAAHEYKQPGFPAAHPSPPAPFPAPHAPVYPPNPLSEPRDPSSMVKPDP
jgi:hypothetical protein